MSERDERDAAGSAPDAASTSFPDGNDDDGLAGDFRSGYVALVGLANVGKSTLMNALVGQKLAGVTPRPQTTRHRIMGVFCDERRQIVFFDTPGLLEPKTRLHGAMLRSARQAIQEADVILAIHDVTRPPEGFTHTLTEASPGGRVPVVVALNKVDRIKKPELLPLIARFHEEAGGAEIVPVSALTGDNVDALLRVITDGLPPGPPLYPEETLTEQPERFFVAELIREQVLLRFRDEVPHAVEVLIEQFVESPGRRDEIDATICVERESQKRILVGAGGKAIKSLGIAARQSVEEFLGRPVVLRLFVKVVPDWRSDAASLRRMGYEG